MDSLSEKSVCVDSEDDFETKGSSQRSDQPKIDTFFQKKTSFHGKSSSRSSHERKPKKDQSTQLVLRLGQQVISLFSWYSRQLFVCAPIVERSMTQLTAKTFVCIYVFVVNNSCLSNKHTNSKKYSNTSSLVLFLFLCSKSQLLHNCLYQEQDKKGSYAHERLTEQSKRI